MSDEDDVLYGTVTGRFESTIRVGWGAPDLLRSPDPAKREKIRGPAGGPTGRDSLAEVERRRRANRAARRARRRQR